MSRKAFTLAEVLITITVIGVIAAITVPSLILTYKKQTLKTQLKKVYSELSQVTDRYTIEQGRNLTDLFYENKDLFLQNFSSYYQIQKLIFYNNRAEIQNIISEKYYTLNHLSALRQDFFSLCFFKDNQDRNYFIGRGNGTVLITVDINGENKAPNTLGIDVFSFIVDENGKLQPQNEFWYCQYNITSNVNGYGCAYSALFDKYPSDKREFENKNYWNDFIISF